MQDEELRDYILIPSMSDIISPQRWSDMADEHPDPIRMRKKHINLNGQWNFAFDDEDVGLGERWQESDITSDSLPFKQRINVPYAFQWEQSGICKPHEIHEVVWYARKLPSLQPYKDQRMLLHFGAVDYQATVFVNGRQVASHTGGHTPFEVDIADFLNFDKDNTLVVRAFDSFTDLNQPRGKQYWKTQPEGIFYTSTTGIWQSVWLEPVPSTRINAKTIRLFPNINNASIRVEVAIVNPRADLNLEVEVTCQGVFISKSTLLAASGYISADISVNQADGREVSQVLSSESKDYPSLPEGDTLQKVFLWSPENPVLYDLSLRLIDSKRSDFVIDHVQAYTGMREVSVVDGKWCLNKQPYFQRLVLDQGYWPKSGMTATDAELKRDIELSKELGFNGCRKHQKLEDPRFLYWADKLGFLVWSEMGNAYNYSAEAVAAFIPEWTECMERDISHPCIVGYVPINESWGVENVLHDQRQVDYLRTLHYLTKALVPRALLSVNDGWEQPGCADVLGYHDYSPGPDLAKTWKSVDSLMKTGRVKLIAPATYQDQPILCTEYGGTFLLPNDKGGFSEESKEKLYEQVYQRTQALCDSPVVQGFVYTQLADCEQEQNGLLTPDRKHKLDPADARKAITQNSTAIPSQSSESIYKYQG